MKKYILQLAMIFGIPSLANAQKLYVDIDGGYGLRLSALQFGNSTYSSSGTTYKSRTLTLGSGMNFGGNIGYSIKDNIALELGINYLISPFKMETNSGYEMVNISSETDKAEYNWKTTMLRITPAIRLSAGTGKIKIYSRLGICFGILASSVQNEKDTQVHTDFQFPSNSSTNVDDKTWEYKGGMGFGLMGSMGLMYSLNDKLNLFFEANAISQNWAPKKASMTKNTTNGVDYLPTLTTSQKEIDFVDEYTISNNFTPPSSTSPAKQIKIYFPTSCVSLNIGIHIPFGGKKEEEK